MTQSSKPKKVVYAPLVCIYCRSNDHKKCPGCDCSQVKHVLEDVDGLRDM